MSKTNMRPFTEKLCLGRSPGKMLYEESDGSDGVEKVSVL